MDQKNNLDKKQTYSKKVPQLEQNFKWDLDFFPQVLHNFLD